MRKIVGILLVLAMVLGGAMAFASGGKEAPKAAKKITVASITYTTEIEWFYILEQNYKQVAAGLGIELIQLDPGAKPQTQVDMIEQMTQKGVDAILISPVDPQVIKAAVQEAMKKGIHVLIQGQERETVPWSTANFGYNEKQMGTLTGEIAAAGFKTKYPSAKSVKLAVLGDPGWASSNIRMGGAQRRLHQGAARRERQRRRRRGHGVDDRDGHQRHRDGAAAASRPAGVVGINDDAAIGAVGAMQQKGIDILKEACIAGAGNNKGTWPYIDRGEVLGSVDLNHRGTAEVALNAVVKLVKGEKVPEMMYIDMIKVTPANLGQWYKK